MDKNSNKPPLSMRGFEFIKKRPSLIIGLLSFGYSPFFQGFINLFVEQDCKYPTLSVPETIMGFGLGLIFDFLIKVHNDVKETCVKIDIQISKKIEGMELFFNLSKENQSFIRRTINISSNIETYKTYNKFYKLSGTINKEIDEIYKPLTQGIISIPFLMGNKMHKELVNHYKRMDAVSYDDLYFWESIAIEDDNNIKHNEEKIPNDKTGAIKYGKKYYESITAKIGLKNFAATRLFLLNKSRMNPNTERLLAEILNRHVKDNIGVAVAFIENISDPTEEWIDKNLFKDFALFDTNQAVAFFRNRTDNKYEVYIRNEAYNEVNNLISLQSQLHKTLIVAAILGNNKFSNDMKILYKDDWTTIDSQIKSLRNSLKKEETLRETMRFPRNTSSIFSVNLDDIEIYREGNESVIDIYIKMIQRAKMLSGGFKQLVLHDYKEESVS